MSGHVEQQLRAELGRLERLLAHAGFLLGEVRVIDEGTWGRLDALVEGTNLAGKIQIHLGKKGRVSIVPQGSAAVAIAAAIGAHDGSAVSPNPPRPIETPRATCVSPPTPAIRASTGRPSTTRASRVRGRAGELVVDCSKFGGSLIGPTEWRGVVYTDEAAWREIFHSPVYARGHNNLGEFLAIIDACRRIERGELTCATLLSDSKTALSWFRTGKIKTTIDVESDCDAGFATEVRDAREWLNTADRPKWFGMMSRWDTSERGENPADFGRK